MELPPKSKGKYSFPVIVGTADSEPISTRAARMRIYNALVRELDADGSNYSKDLSEVDAISREVAHDIRNQYIIGYKPATGKQDAGYRTVRVEAKAPGHGKMSVRTRTGYYSGQERAAAAGGQ